MTRLPFILIILGILIVIISLALFSMYFYIKQIKTTMTHYKNTQLYKYTKIFKSDGNSIQQRLKILLFTFDDRFHEYQNYTRFLNKIYCDKYNIDYRDYSYLRDKLQNIPPWWIKVIILQYLLRSELNYDYFIWMDKDACFVNTNSDVKVLLNTFPNAYFFISNDPNYDEYDRTNDSLYNDLSSIFRIEFLQNKLYVNSGVFIVKNNNRGRIFVNKWLSFLKDTEWYKCNPQYYCNTLDLINKYPYLTGGNWRTTSAWSGDTYEQGSLQTVFKEIADENGIIILPSYILANVTSKNLLLVSHQMSIADNDRLTFFKLVYQQVA